MRHDAWAIAITFGSARILRAVFRIMRDTSLVRQDAESRKLSGLKTGAIKMFT